MFWCTLRRFNCRLLVLRAAPNNNFLAPCDESTVRKKLTTLFAKYGFRGPLRLLTTCPRPILYRVYVLVVVPVKNRSLTLFYTIATINSTMYYTTAIDHASASLKFQHALSSVSICSVGELAKRSTRYESTKSDHFSVLV